MINKNSNNESENSNNITSKLKQTLLPIVMSTVLIIQTQAANAVDNNFYNAENSYLNKSSTIGKMEKKYERYLLNYLKKDFEEGVDKGLVTTVKAKWDKISFITYLDQLLRYDKDLSIDDSYQIAQLREAILETKEEKEIQWPRDFQIIDWNIWKYKFEWDDSFQYLWNNFYAVKIDFDKVKEHKIASWLKIRNTYTKWDLFFIHYDWNNVIKYYSWRSFQDKEPLWHETIDHKKEIVRSWRTIYEKWAEQNIYLKRLWMNLKIKFINN